MALVVKNPSSNASDIRETGRVQSLGLEGPLEEKMTTHSSILAWRSLWTEKPGRLQFMGLNRVGHDWSDLAHRMYSAINHENLKKEAQAVELGRRSLVDYSSWAWKRVRHNWATKQQQQKNSVQGRCFYYTVRYESPWSSYFAIPSMVCDVLHHPCRAPISPGVMSTF